MELSVLCEMDGDVTGVRYAWRESPCQEKEKCPLYSVENNLPAPPFVLGEPQPYPPLPDNATDQLNSFNILTLCLAFVFLYYV